MLAAALMLDALLGEPRWLWSRVAHPVVVVGKLISWLDQRLNRGPGRRAKGVVAVCALLAATLPIPVLIAAWEHGWLLEVIGGAVLLAHRSLVDHVRAVADGLGRSLDEGRAAVAMIVGRDPERLDGAGVSRAAIESAAENFSDGVVAPAFWFAVAGLPGIVAYKVVNTADSMIGHRSEHYLAFGWAAARLDDVLNWVPARLTGLAICLVAGGRRAWEIMRRDAPGHRSPNAGWPEAAMAASLDVALAGPRVYAEGTVDDPFMNGEGRRDANHGDIRAAIGILWRTWVLLVALAVVGALVL